MSGKVVKVPIKIIVQETILKLYELEYNQQNRKEIFGSD